MEKSLLVVRNLRTYYRASKGSVKAVDDVSLEIRKGEVVGLLGESGCGKSTLCFSIPRLVVPTSPLVVTGEILFRGKDLLKLSDREMNDVRGKQITMVFQDPATYLNPILRIGDQMSETIENMNLSKAEKGKRIAEVLKLVGLGSITRNYPFQLSDGMKQRVLIAMAVLPRPSLLIADEPTTSLDVTIQLQVIKLLHDLVRELAFSMLIVTHDWGIISKFADRVYIMYGGQVMEGGDVISVYKNPLHPYTRCLMDCILDVNKKVEIAPTIEGEPPDLINPPRGCRFQPRCKFVREKCVESNPPLVDFGGDRSVRCWLHRG